MKMPDIDAIQASISLKIKRLEESLGRKLLERTPRLQ
jgi:DNA-binding transcriptional LysR family regulator